MHALSPEQKRTRGTAQRCRETVDLEGRPAGKDAGPPKSFSAAQKRAWLHLFDIFDAHGTVTMLDLPSLDLVALAYARALEGDCAISDLKTTVSLLAKFGAAPDSRRNVQPVKKQEVSQLATLRARRGVSSP